MINQLRQRAGVRAIVGNAFIAALAVFAAGCDLSTGEATSNTLHQFVQVRNPVGHVQGLVTDSNNRPLQGALVTVGSRQTTTNSGGMYEFRDLEVVNVSNTSGDQEDTAHDELRIVISPNASTFAPSISDSPTSTRYLGAIVRVYPEAQFNAPGEFSDADTGDTTTGGQQTVFVDGFRVEADPAVLPALTATVEILALRDSDTEEVVANTAVALDFLNVDNSAADEPADGGVQYQTVSFRGTTDASGSVTFTNIPANSNFRLHIRGYSCDGDADNADLVDTCFIKTENEEEVVTYSNFFLARILDSGDEAGPFVTSVAGNFADSFGGPSFCVTGAGTGIALLNRTITGQGTGTIRITVSEPLAPIAAAAINDSLAVYDADAEEYVDLTSIAVSGRTITVTTAAPLPAGADLDVFMFGSDYQDFAGNPIADGGAVDFDCDVTVAVGGAAVALRVFEQPETDRPAVAAAQEQVDPSESGTDNDLPFNQALSSAFNDVDDSGFPDNSVSQMNFDEIDSGALSARANAFGAIAGVGEAFGPFDTNVVRIEFVPDPEATGYRITRDGNTGDQSVVDPDEFDFGPLAFPGDSSVDGSTLRVHAVERVAGTTLFGFTLEDSDEGDTITIEALDDLGNAGAVETVAVNDNVRPTVTVQSSYQDQHSFPGGVEDDPAGVNLSDCFNHDAFFGGIGENHAGVSLAAASSSVGDGGELVIPGTDDEVGNLCIGSSPELLANAAAAATSVHSARSATDPRLEGRRDADFSAVAANVTLAPRAYDGAALTGWLADTDDRTVIMGAAFTEDLAPTVGTVVDTTTAALSSFFVQNNTATTHFGGTPLIEDLVAFTVNDVYVLANTDHGQTINFTGAVTDLQGNAADASADAALTVRDIWPPYLATGTTRDASGNLVFTFDTAVTITGGDVIALRGNGTTVPITLTTVPANFVQSNAGRTITRNTSGLPELAGYSTLFDNAALTYDDGVPATQHAIADFSAISDTRGNRWDNHVAIVAPEFIMPDALGPFTVTMAETHVAAATVFTVTLTSSHATWNWFDTLASVSPDPLAADSLFTAETGTNCVEAADGSVACTAVFGAAKLTTNSATCTTPTRTANLNVAHTVLTFNVTCNAAPIAGETFTVTFDDGFGVADDGRFFSDFDGTTATPAGTGVVYTGGATGTAVITLN